MGEQYSFNPEEVSEDKLEKKAKRLADTIRKLEKGVISEADEATHIARGSIRAMGFGITPVAQKKDDKDK